ncbi:MAG TPA: hypothetical protein VG778_05550 [Blastocatellia bacterium]|jgi:hypothetical protein|nr:hypothetical protein [Blastocatellia bacterium]
MHPSDFTLPGQLPRPELAKETRIFDYMDAESGHADAVAVKMLWL